MGGGADSGSHDPQGKEVMEHSIKQLHGEGVFHVPRWQDQLTRASGDALERSGSWASAEGDHVIPLTECVMSLLCPLDQVIGNTKGLSCQR